ncbi:MAG: NADAR family protein [Spirochaetes bacterium]|nr:NADAR family protein [Spirochaetota bacterium]
MDSNIKEPMPPLWLMYPYITRYSIGWRMGAGEGYTEDFWKWFGSLANEDKETYAKMFPEPKVWRGIYNPEHKNKEKDEFYFLGVELWNKKGEPQYSREKCTAEYNAGGKLEYEFFWKPQSGVINESCLGQWHLSKFSVEIDDYCCAEQYMMAEKARLFEDDETCDAIMKSKDPKEMKALGKKVKNFDQTAWDKAKYSIVLNGNYYKFSQDEDLRGYLLSTGNKILVEASPLDTIWGIGLGKENEKAHNPNTWRGKNLLGFALMEVRDEIQNVYKNYDKIKF